MSKYEIDVWEYADEFKNLDTNETFYGYQVCELLEHKDQQISDLETKLAECEKSKESYRLQNEQHHLQLLQFYSRLGVEAFGADIHEKALETLMIMKEQLAEKEKEVEILKTALGQASIEAFGKKESFVSSNYPKKIVNANEYMEFLIYIASKEKENGNNK